MDLKLDLYVITDARLAGPRGTLAVVEAALAGGADVVQLREKAGPGVPEPSTRKLVELGRVLRELTRRAGALLIVNDRLDVALAVEADGVHVGQDDLPADLARRLLGPRKVVGVSAGSVAEALAAQRDGADYLGVGPIYTTGTKPDAGAATGPELITAIKRATGLPVVGIGGVNAANTPEVVAAGADGVAVISAVVAAPDPRLAAASIRAAVQRARAR